MNFFGSELKKIMEKSDILKDQKYVGRTAYGTIDGDIRAKLEFKASRISDHYDGIKVSIINRKEGVVDGMSLNFSDVWGRKKVNNPNFKDGIMPHIWSDRGENEWYVFQPTKEDYRQLSAAVEEYLSVFQDMEMTQQDGSMQMMS